MMALFNPRNQCQSHSRILGFRHSREGVWSLFAAVAAAFGIVVTGKALLSATVVYLPKAVQILSAIGLTVIALVVFAIIVLRAQAKRQHELLIAIRAADEPFFKEVEAKMKDLLK
jgi:hypothetical protein